MGKYICNPTASNALSLCKLALRTCGMQLSTVLSNALQCSAMFSNAQQCSAMLSIAQHLTPKGPQMTLKLKYTTQRPLMHFPCATWPSKHVGCNFQRHPAAQRPPAVPCFAEMRSERHFFSMEIR